MVKGAPVFTRITVSNVFTASYSDSAVFSIPAGVSFEFSAWDRDAQNHDSIIQCTIDPITADDIGWQVLTCQGIAATGTLGTTLEIRLVPQ